MSTTAPTDPRRDDAPTTQDPPTTAWTSLRQIGPGLILAGAIVGTGELIATTNLGAKVGFTLLWLVILSCFIKVFVQVELGRFAVSAGEGTFASFRRLPGPGLLLVWWCALMLLVTQTQVGAMIGGVGQALHMAAPGAAGPLASAASVLGTRSAAYATAHPEFPWAILATVVTAALLATGSYRLVERGTTLLVVTFTFMTVLCVVFLPAGHAIGLGDLARGLSFRLPLDRDSVRAAFTMVGITGVGASELLAYPYWCIEKGYARYVGPREAAEAWAARARGWLRVMKLDAWVSMAIYTVSTLAFYLLGAAVLHRSGADEPETIGQMLDTLAMMYRPVLGPAAARWFVVIGAFAVLYSTLFAATAGTSRLLADFLRVNGLIDAQSEAVRRRWVRRFCVLLPLLALGLFLTIGNPVQLVMIGGIMQGVSLPLIAAGALFLRYRRTDPRIRPGRVWDGFLVLSMLGLSLAAGYSIWTEIAKALG